MFKCEKFFVVEPVSDETKINLACVHLEAKALAWHQAFITRWGGTPLSWKEYKEALISRFGKSLDDPHAELKALKQIGSI